MPLAAVRWLLTPHPPLWRQCLLYSLADLVPSGLLLAIVYSILAVVGADSRSLQQPSHELTIGSILGSLVFAPLVETALLAGLLRLLLLASPRLPYVAAVSALLLTGCALFLVGTRRSRIRMS